MGLNANMPIKTFFNSFLLTVAYKVKIFLRQPWNLDINLIFKTRIFKEI